MMTVFKLGRNPSPVQASLKLADYVDLSVALPKVPTKVGHPNLIPTDLGMLGNDSAGDCVWAGAGHETMAWNAFADKTVNITTENSLSDYTAVTGYSPNDPNSDQGTDMVTAAKYRQKTGVVDAAGKRHTIGAYISLRPGDLAQLRLGIHLFGAVGVGVLFPDFWMDEFNAGQPWIYKSVPKPQEGHYVSAFASDGPHGWIEVATWGKLQRMSAHAYQEFNDESLAYVSLEMLKNGKSIEGFNAAQLYADLKAVTKA